MLTRYSRGYVLALIGATLAASSSARAIPAFARKYHTTCARCHSVVPRLNNYGWNFKLRGFHVPGDEQVGTLPMPEDKNLTLIDLPLALRFFGNVQGSTARGSQGVSTLDSEIDILSAGQAAPRIGYWGEVDTVKNPDGSFSVGIGSMRAIFTDLVRRHPTALNVELGTFAADEFGISTMRALTMNPYAIYTVGSALGNFAESSSVQGLNFYGAVGTGIGKEVAPTAQKQAKAGQVTAQEEQEMEKLLKETPAQPAPQSPEVTAAKAVLDVLVKKGTITQQDADQTLNELAAKLGPPPAPPPSAAQPTGPVTLAKSDYDVRKGLFYQAALVTRGAPGGSEPQGYGRLIYANKHDWWMGPIAYVGSNTIAGSPGFLDRFSRYGLEAGFTAGAHRDVAGVERKAIEVYLAGQYGSDSNAAGTGVRVEHLGGFAEASYVFDDRNLAVVRWDRLTSNKMPGLDVSTFTLNYTRYLRRNLKIGLEYVPDLLGNSATHTHGDEYFAFYDFTF